MPKTRTFTVEELDDLGLPYDFYPDEDWKPVTQDVGEARWGTRRLAIFPLDGTHWAVQFYDPATEMQEGMDIWEDQDSVTATEMVAVEVTVTRWEPAP